MDTFEGLNTRGIPDAFAQAGSGYLSGYWQGGSEAANSGSAYGFAGSILGAALFMGGVDAEPVPAQNSAGWEKINKTNDTFAVTPELAFKSPAGESLWQWIVVGLFSGGNEHSWHAKDSLHYPFAENPGYTRYYRPIQSNVTFPGESYLHAYSLRANNCTTRFGSWSPNQYFAKHQYIGPSSYWNRR